MVRVSDIETIRGGRVRVRLDDGSDYLLLKSMLRERPLEINQPLDPREFSRWVAEKQYRSALEKAVAMLTLRPCGRGELEQKLRRVGYAPESIGRVLSRLEEAHLLDDRSFAEAWAHSRSSRRYGPRRISAELRHKGVSEEDTAAALEALDDVETRENAESVARKALSRAKPGEDPMKTRRRILEILVRRGYSWEDARAACDNVLEKA